MRIVTAVILELAACQTAGDIPDLPWIHGLTDVVVSTRSSDEVGRKIADWSERAALDPGCPIGSYPGIELTADVAPSPGGETTLVSLAHGVAIFDREGELVSETPGYQCEGSADELEAVAVGRAYGERTLVIAATTGGHRASQTWITMLRVDDDRSLDAVFTGTVEERDGGIARRGSILVLPSALLYRPPGALVPALWIYDRHARAYLPPGQDVDRSRRDGPLVSRR